MSNIFRLTLVLFIIVSLLSGCASKSVDMSNPNWSVSLYDGDCQPDAIMEYLLQFVVDSNQEALKQLLSEDIVGSIDDIDTQIADFISFIQGDILLFDEQGSYISESYENGDYIKTACCSYLVSTSTEDYYIALMYIANNTSNTTQRGIHSIYVIQAEDADPAFVYWGGHQWKPGITIETD